jgi:very-short-patch-repair endonuclease
MRRAQPWKTNRARTLRANAPAAEIKLWLALRDRRLGGYKFVRQAPIESYFANFLCREARLIIEIDGATHSTESELAADTQRTRALEALGYQVLRVDNVDVLENIEGVAATILETLEARGRRRE